MVRLDACTDIISGATPSTAVKEFWDGGIHWATPRDLSELDEMRIAATGRTITDSGLASCAATILPAGSVLFSSRAPIGHVAINTVPMATNQGFKSFIPMPDKLEAEFLYWWLRLNKEYLQGLGSGATFKELSRKAVARVEIPLPPLPEQRRIAEILNKADALRAKRREAIAQLGPLTSAIFLDMFGDPATNTKRWPVVQLGALIRADDSINYGVVQPGDDYDQGVPLVRVGDLVDGGISHLLLKRIDPKIEANFKRSRLRGDELLVSCVGTIGVVALASDSVRGFNIARAVARIPLDAGTNRVFMGAYLRTDFVQRYFVNELRTVSQPTLNIKQISETPVVLPPTHQQHEFERRAIKVERIRAAHRGASSETDALFETLSDRAFRGAL